MATWKVEPTWKKSVIERNYLEKDGDCLVVETVWRWGEFLVYTEDSNPPDLDSGVDIMNCGYRSELVQTDDACGEDYDYSECSDEQAEWLENFFDEGNSWLDLEEHGWSQTDGEIIIDCDLDIQEVNE